MKRFLITSWTLRRFGRGSPVASGPVFHRMASHRSWCSSLPIVGKRLCAYIEFLITSYSTLHFCSAVLIQVHFTYCRHQNPEKRPSFPDVVDELLAIEKDLPDTKYTEVTL